MARLGGTYAVFGTDDETYGIIKDVEKALTVEENELPRGDGEVYAVQTYKGKYAYSGTFVAIAAGGPDWGIVGNGVTFVCPDLGDSIYVKSLTQKKTAEDWQEYSFEGSSWTHLGSLTTTTTTTSTTTTTTTTGA